MASKHSCTLIITTIVLEPFGGFEVLYLPPLIITTIVLEQGLTIVSGGGVGTLIITTIVLELWIEWEQFLKILL